MQRVKNSQKEMEIVNHYMVNWNALEQGFMRYTEFPFGLW